MNALSRLALRNLIRNRRQSALTVAIVAFGTWAIIVLWGFTEGTTDSMIRSQVTLDTGELQVHREGYRDDPNLELAFTEEQFQSLQTQLDADSDIRGVSPRLITEGLLQSAYGNQGVIIRGFDPEHENQVTFLQNTVEDGVFIQGEGEILIGRSLAERLDIRLGERIVIQAQGLNRARSKGFRVVGLLSIGLSLLDDGMVFIHINDAQNLTGVSTATEIALSLNGKAPESLKSELQPRLGNAFEVSSFFDLNPLVGLFAQVGQFRMLPLMLILGALAGFGVANTVTFTVLQRTREFGVMLALGLKPKQLSRLITFESLSTGMIGFMIGAFFGFLLNFYLQSEGINMQFYSDAFPDLGVPHILYSKVAWWHGFYGWIVVMLTALISARYPARRAASLEPTEAMRYV